jgi:hypothetical protein
MGNIPFFRRIKMAYSNWGAFVFCNGKRRTDKEDVGVFDTDESCLPSGARIFANILKNHEADNKDWSAHSHHAVLGDGPIRLCGYKSGPELWRFADGKPEQIDLDVFISKDSRDDYTHHSGTLDGYEFEAEESENMLDIFLREPNGTEWTSTCGYCYGAGHTDC